MSEYDRRAEAWVRLKFGAIPDAGSVRFENDCAAYASGGWAETDVSWTVNGAADSRTLSDSAWQYDWTQIIRELLQIDLDANPWIPLDRDGLPPESYPAWRAQEHAKREAAT